METLVRVRDTQREQYLMFIYLTIFSRVARHLAKVAYTCRELHGVLFLRLISRQRFYLDLVPL